MWVVGLVCAASIAITLIAGLPTMATEKMALSATQSTDQATASQTVTANAAPGQQEIRARYSSSTASRTTSKF